MKKKALGKGLEAFVPAEYGILKQERFMELDIVQLKPNPGQPRHKFDPDTLNELAQSIHETGILQPIVAVPEDDHFRIIVGERRWRAAQIAGLKKIPVLIRSMTPEQQQEATLIENLQREDLNPMEIAAAYQKMADDLNLTQQEIADRVGKDRASVANYIRLLKLPDDIQTMIRESELTMGHARALLALDEPELQWQCAREAAKKGLSVRDVERKIQKLKQEPRDKPRAVLDPDLMTVQEDLVNILGTKVSISGKADKGSIRIDYYSLEELNRIYERIKGVIP